MPQAEPASSAANAYAALLRRDSAVAALRAPSAVDVPPPSATELARDIANDWAVSGLMPLTGAADGPPRRAGHALPSCARGALLALRELAWRPLPAALDGAHLLSERAAYHGWPRRGRSSVNGHCHLLRTHDGWLAINLARGEDLQLLPAWLAPLTLGDAARKVIASGELAELEKLVAQLPGAELRTRGALLGLPVALPGETAPPPRWFAMHNAVAQPRQQAPRDRPPRVLDLSTLWAGPLATHLLQLAGAEVWRLDNDGRPDPSASHLPAFHALLNANKQVLAVDLETTEGVARLRNAIDVADIVVESARPRALRQRGIDWRSWVGNAAGPTLWVRITGHDTDDGDDNTRVAFGDDAAIAGGAGLIDADGPAFCGDALADPLTGIHAALATLAQWRAGTVGLLAMSLAEVTAWCTGFAADVPQLEPSAATIAGPHPRPSPSS